MNTPADHLRAAVAAVLAAVSVLACSTTPTPPGGAAASTQGAPAEVEGAAADGRIVARVNGTPLYRGFYDQILQYRREALQKRKGGDSVEAYLNARFDALESLVNDELIYQHARSRGMIATDRELQGEMERLARAAKGEAALLRSFQALGIDRDLAFEGIRKRLTVDKFIEQELAAGLEITDAQLIAYYNEHIDRFTPELWVKVSHILIRCERSAPADEVEEALSRATRILANIRSGQAFERLAREFSEDRSAALGGSIGLIKRGATYAEFEAVAFTLQPGEVSEPVRTDVGFHLIRVSERRGGVPKRFEDAREDCRLGVLSRQKATLIRGLVDRLRPQATIETYLR